ncbi:MAG: transferase [Pseudomonadales bacterium]|nr:transferase [Pseudomonadales bacterium]
MNRLYCFWGFIFSAILSTCPSFRVSRLILCIPGNRIEKGVTVHSRVRFIIPTRLEIGSNSTINANSLIDSRQGIKIGSNTMIGRGVKIFTLGHNVDDEHFGSSGGKVIIGNNVVIFPYSLIMPGVLIEDNAVIYPGSVVTRNVKENEIVGGNPAKFIRLRQCKPKYSLEYNMYFGV